MIWPWFIAALRSTRAASVLRLVLNVLNIHLCIIIYRSIDDRSNWKHVIWHTWSDVETFIPFCPLVSGQLQVQTEHSAGCCPAAAAGRRHCTTWPGEPAPRTTWPPHSTFPVSRTLAQNLLSGLCTLYRSTSGDVFKWKWGQRSKEAFMLCHLPKFWPPKLYESCELLKVSCISGNSPGCFLLSHPTSEGQ